MPQAVKQSIKELAELSRENLADAKRAATERAAELEAAEESAADLRRRLAGGDVSVSSAQLTASDIEVERASLLSQAAQRGVNQAIRRLVNDDTTLADLISGAVSRALYGFEVAAVTQMPSQTPDVLPAILVVQGKPASADLINGTISGEVEVIYCRRREHAQMDVDALTASISAVAGTGELRSSTHLDEKSGNAQDVLHVRVSGFSELPIIQGAPQGWRASSLAQGIATSAVLAVHQRHSVTVQNNGAMIGAAHESHSLVKVSTGPDGIRRAVVRLRVRGWAVKNRVGRDDVVKAMRQAIESRVGTCEAGLGRIESAKVLKEDQTDWNLPTATAEVVLVSRDPDLELAQAAAA